MGAPTRVWTLLSLILLSTSLWASQPSFDCKKATGFVEKVICSSDRLAAQDLKLGNLYKNLLSQLPTNLHDHTRQEQRQWLKRRSDCKGSLKAVEACLFEFYRERNLELSAMLAFDSSTKAAGKSLKVLRITPKGNDVAAGQQIVFQFDKSVVPIGRMERDSKDIPVTITPGLNCDWRWLNTSALGCQLRAEDKMQLATRYKVVMRPGIKTEQGAQLQQEVHHSFTTTRPKVTYTRFVNWLSAGTPMIQVTFNQPVTRASVMDTLRMTAVEAADNATVELIAYADNLPRRLPWWMGTSSENEQPGVDDQLTNIGSDEARRVWVVEPRRELPQNQAISLDVKPGLISSHGSEQGVESRSIVRFDTYPDFKFIGIRCTPKGQKQSADLSFDQLTAASAELSRCAPLKRIGLLFSSPVLNSSIKNHVSFTPGLDGNRKDYDPWANIHDWSRLSSPHRKGRDYYVWLPELLKAYQNYQVTFDVDKLTDEFGRRLTQGADFEFMTAHREPRLRLNHNVAVLEKDVDSEVPLYVTNLNQVEIDYDKVTATSKTSGQKIAREIGKAEDVAFAVPMGVRQLLGEQTGSLYARVHPDPVPPDWSRDLGILAQVTPFQVHFKVGHFNSLAWVTRFDNGNPVANARVSLLTGRNEAITQLKELGIAADTDKSGLVKLPGLTELDPDLKTIWGNTRYRKQDGFFVKVEHQGDVALIPLNNDFSVYASGTYQGLNKQGGHTHSWGTTAQGVYKLGDEIQFKIYLRDQSNKHWVAPHKEGYELQVLDPQAKVVFEMKNVILNEFGAFDGTFVAPEQGAVGWYQFELTTKKASGKQPRFSWTPMSVLISDFTPAPFKVKAELNGELFKTKDRVEASALATLHSGGPYTEAEVRLTARLSKKAFVTDNPLAKGFTFSSSHEKLQSEQKKLLDIRGKLNDSGQYDEMFVLPETDIYYGSVLVESAVKDERGKFIASLARADFAGRDRYVGLRNTRWLYQQDKVSQLEALVVDVQGKPVQGVDINIAIRHREYRASRVKGPGNAYLTQNIMQWVGQDSCRISSTEKISTCEFTPEKSGYYQFIATIKDTSQREHQTVINGWVTGSDHVVWDQTNDATLQIVPEQTDYKIGDTARYLIKNPFPGGRALVTIERYGVLDSWVETLSTSTPVIEVPIKPDYLPGFYLSVVVVSPRVEQPLGANNVDLGKPGYRMGYVTAKVVDPYKQLKINVSTDKKTYKPRDKVKAKIHVDKSMLSQKENVEIAVAVVDESVLALNHRGKDYYDPYKGFNRLDPLDVNNYSLISRLVGRQKFEKKGASPGGGGSSYLGVRNLFKFVSYWNPSVQPDIHGNAEIDFQVPDNLTGWRILAFAVSRDDRMGLGDANYKVNRPIEIRPVMPNQVVEGDDFKAGFNVFNRTGKKRQLEVKIAVDGPLKQNSGKLFTYDIELPAYKRQNIWLPLETMGSGALKFTARAWDMWDQDAIEHELPVNKRRSLETAATYGTTTASQVSESIEVPMGIFTDVGSIGATLSPTVLGNIDGAVSYLSGYKHLCWEQRLSKAVGANSYIELKEYLSKASSWETAGEDVRKTLDAATNFQAPNGGMVYWVPSNQHVSPYLSAYTAMTFNWLRRSGYQIPGKVEGRLHDYLLNLLRHDDFPSFYSKSLSSSVRAVALAALSEAGKVNQNDVSRHAAHIAEMDLFGKSHFLQAAIKTAGVSPEIVTQTIDAILGHSSQTGGKFQFNEAWDDSYKYILATPLRSNCSILSSLLIAQTESQQAVKLADIPFKLVRSITQSRGNRDHWENTQENVFCLNALVDYANLYEIDQPDMQVTVSFDNKNIGATAFTSKADSLVSISRTMRENDQGRAAMLDIEKIGQGRLYYSARITYSLREEHASRINSGIEVRREYSVERDDKFVLLKSPMQIKRGDVVRVDLYLSSPVARHFVAVNDPIPGGLEPVNTNLATASQVDAGKGAFKASDGAWFYKFNDWSYYGRYFWSFYHQELRHDSARFYADYLPAGNYHLSYTTQAIAEGQFSAMSVHAEEMYDPDVYGKGLPATLIVGE